MPVTQRWVHGGLILAVVVLSTCLTVLILGSSRGQQNDSGLPNSRAANFYLKDLAGDPVSYDSKQSSGIQLLVFASRESSEMATHADVVNQLVSTYLDDKQVQIIGISYVRDASLLGPGETETSVMERKCSQLRIVRDLEGGVARAYRVSATPTLIVIDSTGVIRGRVSINKDGAESVVREIIDSLRSSRSPAPMAIGGISSRR